MEVLLAEETKAKEEATNQIASLGAQVQRAIDERSRLAAESQAAARSFAEREASLIAGADAARKEFSERLASLESSLAAAETRLEEEATDKTDLMNEIASLRAHGDVLTQKVARLADQQRGAEEAVVREAAASARSQDEAAALRAQTESTVARLQDSLKRAEDDKAEDARRHSKEAEGLRSDIDRLQHERDDLAKQVRSVEERHRDALLSADTRLGATQTAQGNEIAELSKALIDARENLATTAAKIAIETERLNAEHSGALEGLEEQLAEVRQQSAAAEETRSSQAAVLTARNDLTEKERARAATERAEAVARLRETQERLTAAQSRMAEMDATLAAQESLRVRLEAMERESEDLRKSLDLQAKELATRSEAARAWDEHRATIEARAAEAEGETARLRAELDGREKERDRELERLVGRREPGPWEVPPSWSGAGSIDFDPLDETLSGQPVDETPRVSMPKASLEGARVAGLDTDFKPSPAFKPEYEPHKDSDAPHGDRMSRGWLKGMTDRFRGR